MNGGIANWRQSGVVSLWHYKNAPRMYADWHLSANPAGCENFCALLDLFNQSGSSAHRTLTNTDPRVQGVDRIFGEHDLSLIIPAKVRLEFSAEAGTVGSLAQDDAAAILRVVRGDFADLLLAMTDIATGRDDFSMRFGAAEGLTGYRISFWCWPKHRQN